MPALVPDWRCWRLTLSLTSPLHSGWRTLGNVKYCRPYVTGRMMWGAITARLVRDNESLYGYREVGDRVNEELAFSYLYPSEEPDRVAAWPWCRPREFEWLFMGSYASTALVDARTADEGTLHETEFIAPRTRSGRPVYLVGYVFELTGSDLPWREAVGRLQLGAERASGWGRVASPEFGEGPDLSAFGMGWEMRLQTARPQLRPPEGGPWLAHVDSGSGIKAEGHLEPLVGRQTDLVSAAAGVELSQAAICWAPGSRLLGREWCEIGRNGIWRPVQP